jgi:hypothetical protein
VPLVVVDTCGPKTPVVHSHDQCKTASCGSNDCIAKQSPRQNVTLTQVEACRPLVNCLATDYRFDRSLRRRPFAYTDDGLVSGQYRETCGSRGTHVSSC